MAFLRLIFLVSVVSLAVSLVQPAKIHQSRQQCSLGQEVSLKPEGRRVMMVPVYGGLGAPAARTSCISHSASPLFLNTQDDADILHRLLKDCVKTGQLSSVWVPARRHLELKRIDRPDTQSRLTATGNVEYDWMSAHYNRTSDDITLLPFPKYIHERKGIICVKRNQN
ncbi:uncharacterized protein [Macrobrachium rosenbergii]|uniref:uncharacterized protein n=1 Tax=Macrobrachium rosenbergii TaxID=79674 RepID=UPI0034D46846